MNATTLTPRRLAEPAKPANAADVLTDAETALTPTADPEDKDRAGDQETTLAPYEVIGLIEGEEAQELEVHIDPEYSFDFTLTEEADHALGQQLVDEGLLLPIDVAEQDGVLIVVDGRRRRRLCKQYDLALRYRVIKFESRDATLDYVLCRHLSRHNLTPLQLTYVRGKRYDLAPKIQGKRTVGQNVPKSRTSEQIAAEFGVDEKTIRRNAEFARAVDKLNRVNPAFRGLLLAGELDITNGDVAKLGQARPIDRDALEQLLGTGKYEKPAGKRESDPLAPMNKAWNKAAPEEQRLFLTGLLEEDEVRDVVQELLGAVSNGEDSD